MTETVVHVTTLDQWKSVLDVWFKRGYSWPLGEKEYSAEIFENGGRFLFLDDCITYSRLSFNRKKFIEYSEFVAQERKRNNEMETYYVTQEQLDLIVDLKKGNWPLARLVNSEDIFNPLNNGLEMVEEKAILRYLGGDETIDFKEKKQLYRLWLTDTEQDKVYFRINLHNTPSSTEDAERAFTAPLEEIEKWKTPAWEIEEAD